MTKALLVALVFFLAAYDVAIWWYCGPEATLSRVILSCSQRCPIIAFALGVLIGHVYWPN